jgi:8-oxo-dGTP pyrophosphatase MutT (NUDIX family)
VRTDGDGWTRCARGHDHWGRHGAAGLLLRHVDVSGAAWVLLQHRAGWSHHGGTWGVPGGARARHESAEQTALRETSEEVVVDLSGVRIARLHRDDHGGWAYDTVIADAPTLLAVAPGGHETSDIRWVPVDEVVDYPLHPGFAASWPLLRGE